MAGFLLLSPALLNRVQVIDLFIYLAPTWGLVWSLTEQWRRGIPYTVYSLLGKTNVKHILSSILNCNYDHCSKVVKDIMGVLTGGPGLDCEGQEAFPAWRRTFEMARKKWTELFKESSQVQSFGGERNQRYHLAKPNLCPLTNEKTEARQGGRVGKGLTYLLLALKLHSLWATGLEMQTELGFLRWVGMEMYMGRRRD